MVCFILLFLLSGLCFLIFFLISEFCCKSPSGDIDHGKARKDHAYETEGAIGLVSKVIVSSSKENATVCQCQEDSLDQGLVVQSRNEHQASNEEEVNVKIGKHDRKEKSLAENPEDEEWEGIERSETDRNFGRAVAYVGSKDNAAKVNRLNTDVRLRLYGLHKVAIEEACLVPQPMALKVSARAKWKAWQQLGDMDREAAMEQYINLLSKNIPDWMGDNSVESADSQGCRNLTNEILMAALPDRLGDVDDRTKRRWTLFSQLLQEPPNWQQ